MNVFILEDDILWRTKLEMMAEEIGLDVIGTSDNILKSRAFLSSNLPDLIIADVMLGEGKSFDLFADGQFAEIPVLFITLSIDPDNYKLAKDKKNSHFLVKPFHQLSLRAAIDAIFKNYEKATLEPTQGIIVRGKYNEKITLQPARIIWVKQDRNYCFIKTSNQQFALKTSLINVFKYLGNNNFIQINKACIFNKTADMRIDMNTKQLKVNDELVPIGRKYKDGVLKHISENK